MLNVCSSISVCDIIYVLCYLTWQILNMTVKNMYYKTWYIFAHTKPAIPIVQATLGNRLITPLSKMFSEKLRYKLMWGHRILGRHLGSHFALLEIQKFITVPKYCFAFTALLSLFRSFFINIKWRSHQRFSHNIISYMTCGHVSRWFWWFTCRM